MIDIVICICVPFKYWDKMIRSTKKQVYTLKVDREKAWVMLTNYNNKKFNPWNSTNERSTSEKLSNEEVEKHNLTKMSTNKKKSTNKRSTNKNVNKQKCQKQTLETSIVKEKILT